MAASLSRSRSSARRRQASSRRSVGQWTLSIPRSETPRRMNGATRRGQVHAAGEPAGGDRAAVAGLREHVGERRRADAVDRRRPLLLAERLAGRAQRRPVDDLVGAERLEIGGLARAARRGDDPPALAGEERDRHRADAAGRSGHQRRRLRRASRSWRSIAISASIAVKPAVPIAIASARVSPAGSLDQPVAVHPRAFRHSRRNGSR